SGFFKQILIPGLSFSNLDISSFSTGTLDEIKLCQKTISVSPVIGLPPSLLQLKNNKENTIRNKNVLSTVSIYSPD
ncbi:MAG TPA: hypothetical protein VMT35_19555, partial [Ignavibacteriaceae bacterium]|nr:hypothetical protein [Ignavibacteriaceae bacterium]